MAIENTKYRKYESRKKFFNGLYAEYTGFVINESGYIDSKDFINILNKIKCFIDEDATREHKLYKIGKSFLDSNKENKNQLIQIKNILGDDWKNVRFRNLVRLGADIENAGLGELSRATLVGSLLHQKQKKLREHHGQCASDN